MRKGEDTKGVIRTYKLKKDSQYNGKTKDKRTNNNLQNTTQKTIDWATQTPQQTKDELRCYRWISSYCSASGTCHELLLFNIKLFSYIMVRSYIWWDNYVCFILGQHAELDLDSASSLKQQSSRHVTSLGLINLILRKPVFALTPEYCMLNGKAAKKTNFIVFGLTWQGLNSTQGEHARWCGWYMIWQQVKSSFISKITSKTSKA
jgi:hypothetical protein